MNQRNFLTAFGIGALFVAPPLMGCGDFSADEGEETATGGAAATGGGTGTGGAAPGSGGSTPGSGGSAPGSGGTVEEPPPEASCENVEPCGGDPAGVWFAIDSCLSSSGTANLVALGIGCAEGAVTGGTYEVFGNWAFDAASGILTDTTQTTGTVELGLGPECKDVSATLVPCSEVAGPLSSIGFSSGTCVDSTTITDGCDCTGEVDQTYVAGFLTTATSDVALYTVSGNTLSLQGNVTVDYDFCVDGEYMHVTPKTTGDGGMVTGTIVFQRQP